MKPELGQAGSVFAGWITSCLFCSTPAGDDADEQHSEDKGVREMTVCDSQPHLISPMRLVLYDDLPSPNSPPRTSSMPSWVNEGRNLVSRASSRASMSFKRRSSLPLRISAPTDFRRVNEAPAAESKDLQPLELTIHTPGNRLSSLPSFEDFQLEERKHITRPPRAFFHSVDVPRSRSHGPSSSFNLPRKPVGSGSRRSSLGTLEHLLERQTPISSPLIPHFSTRPSTTAGLPDIKPIPKLNSAGNELRRMDAKDFTIPRTPKTPTNPNLQDRNLPSIPPGASLPSTPRPPTAPSEPNSTPRRRVTQWLFSTKPTSPAPSQNPTNPSNNHENTLRSRSRTLSGSTLASSFSSMTNFKLTPSLSSLATLRTSSDTRREKEFDLPISRPMPLGASAFDAPGPYTTPTIYEGQQQQQQQRRGQEYSDQVYNHYARHRESMVGLAF